MSNQIRVASLCRELGGFRQCPRRLPRRGYQNHASRRPLHPLHRPGVYAGNLGLSTASVDWRDRKPEYAKAVCKSPVNNGEISMKDRRVVILVAMIYTFPLVAKKSICNFDAWPVRRGPGLFAMKIRRSITGVG